MHKTPVKSFRCQTLFKKSPLLLFLMMRMPVLIQTLRRMQAVARRFVEFTQKLLCLEGQMLGRLYHKRHIMVAAHILVAQGRNALAL